MAWVHLPAPFHSVMFHDSGRHNMIRVLVVLLVSVIVSSLTFAGDGARQLKNRVLTPALVDDGSSGVREHRDGGNAFTGPNTTLNWVLVDSMGNAFGPASRGVKPIAYDPSTGVVALLHRGDVSYAASTGQLWYNLSHNGAATWRRVSDVNFGVDNRLRYPSAAISNPTNSADTNDAVFVWAAPLLDASGTAFGFMAYGVDLPLGTGAGVGFQSTGTDFWSNAHIWTRNGGPDIVWVAYRYLTTTTLPADLWRFRTADFLTNTEGVPTTWAASSFNTSFGLDIGGTERNGTHYMGKWGPFNGDPNWEVTDNVGYSTSTDGGMNWGAWVRPQPDWRAAVGLPSHQEWWTYGGPGAYSKEMLVDANNKVHFFGVTFDTLTQQRSVVEVYETASGWGGKLIQGDLKESTALNYPGTAGDLNQMGNHLNGSISDDGNVMALVWLDADVQGQTLPDIWFSWRRITDADWATPVNLTQTSTFAELLLHAAPTLRTDANGWTIFLGRCYEAGVTTYPPESGNRTNFYIATHSWTGTDVGEENGVPVAFSLKQNYPNPFNPKTNIEYSVNAAGPVSIKVYDMVGREVATIVDRHHAAGRYETVLDASSLASGVYVYRMLAGNFVETRKMALVK